MIFQDRQDAGRQLARQLEEFANRTATVVLGIPRGGVVVASEIALALHLPLDVFLSHKLGVPGHEELAFGAIAAGKALARYLDQQVIRQARVSPADIDRISAEAGHLLERRALLYRRDRPPCELARQTLILVDDGIATGASAYAAIQALRQMHPAMIALAVPVAPVSACAWLRLHVDRVVCLHAPYSFYSVGQFFRSFPQLEDQKMIDLLSRSR